MGHKSSMTVWIQMYAQGWSVHVSDTCPADGSWKHWLLWDPTVITGGSAKYGGRSQGPCQGCPRISAFAIDESLQIMLMCCGFTNRSSCVSKSIYSRVNFESPLLIIYDYIDYNQLLQITFSTLAPTVSHHRRPMFPLQKMPNPWGWPWHPAVTGSVDIAQLWGCMFPSLKSFRRTGPSGTTPDRNWWTCAMILVVDKPIMRVYWSF